MTASTSHLSYLDPARSEPWASFIEQIDRVTPYLDDLSRWPMPVA
jgi:glutamate dehydrogenase (NAD(P)+)